MTLKKLVRLLTLTMPVALAVLSAEGQEVPSYRLMSNTNLPPLPYNPRPWLETITNADGSIIWVDNATTEGQVLDLVATASTSPSPLDSSGPPSPGPGDTNAPPPPWQPRFYFQGLSAPGAGEADTNHPLVWCAYRIWNCTPRAGWDWQQGTTIDDGDIIWCMWPNETMKYPTNWPYGVFTAAVTNGSGVWVTNKTTLYMPAGMNAKRDVLLYHPTLGFTNLAIMNAQITNYTGPYTNQNQPNQGTIMFCPIAKFLTNYPPDLTFPTNWPTPPSTGATNWPIAPPSPPITYTNGTPAPYTNPLTYPQYPYTVSCCGGTCCIAILPPTSPYGSPQCVGPIWTPGYGPPGFGNLGTVIGGTPTFPQIVLPPTGATTAAQRQGYPCGLPGTNYQIIATQVIRSSTNWFVGGTFNIGSNGLPNYLLIDTNAWYSHLNYSNGPPTLFMGVKTPPITVIGGP
jgi:hypothetical protein